MSYQNEATKGNIALDNTSNSTNLSVDERWITEEDLFSGDFEINIKRNFSLRNLIDDEDTELNHRHLCEDCLVIHHQEVFNRNLLKNVFGTGDDPHHNCSRSCELQRSADFKKWLKTKCPKFSHWNIIEPEKRGWKVQSSFECSELLPQEIRTNGGCSYFAASSSRCTKEQLVSLSDEGFFPELMDRVRPLLEVSEWCAAHTNNGSIYELKVSLLDKSQNSVREYSEIRFLQSGQGQWQRVYFRIQDYPPGIRFLMFSHVGLNTMMAGGSIVAKLPCFICRKNWLSTCMNNASTRLECTSKTPNCCNPGTKYNEFT